MYPTVQEWLIAISTWYDGDHVKPIAAGQSGASSRVVAILGVCLVAFTFAAFWPTFGNGFTDFDDPAYVTKNELVKQGLTGSGLVSAFTTVLAGNWHPLAVVSHMVDVQLFHLNAAAHHGMSLAIHALNAVLVLVILNRTTRMVWSSLLVAALFAVHPLRVESVAWVAERKDVLSAFFGLLAIWSYVAYAARPSFLRYFVVGAMMVLSLLAKPMLVTLPFLLLLLDVWPLQRWHLGFLASSGENQSKAKQKTSRILIEKVPFLAIATCFSVVAMVTQRKSGAMENYDLSWLDRIANTLVSYVRYLGKTFWPVELAFLYPYPGAWPVWQVLGAGCLLLVATLWGIAVLRRQPFWLIGWLWFLGTMVPVIGLVQIGHQSMADRYTYFPQIGLFIALVFGVFHGARQASKDWETQVALAKWPVLLFAMACLGLAAATHEQTKVWRNSETLCRHAIASTHDNILVMNLLAALLAEKGDITGAEALWRESARLDPDHLNSELAAYERAMQREPDRLEIVNNVAWMLATHPEPSLRDGPRAIKLALRAGELAGRDDPTVLDTLAAAYAETGDFKQAVAVGRRARDLAAASGQSQLVTLLDQHIQQFQAGQPLRISKQH